MFDYVTGPGEVGQAVIAEADTICFTGSVPTGRKVAVACAERLIPCNLELGGKDPCIVTETADLDRAATAVLRGAVYATGQVCYSVERVYVHESVHDAFVDKLVAQAQAVRLNADNPRAGHIGPFTFAPQAAIVQRHLDDEYRWRGDDPGNHQSKVLRQAAHLFPTEGARMKIQAAVAWEAGATLSIEEFDLDDPRDDEILVRVEAVGVCHTDDNARLGRLPVVFPIILGHEGARHRRARRQGRHQGQAGGPGAVHPGLLRQCEQCVLGKTPYCDQVVPVTFIGTRPDGTPAPTRTASQCAPRSSASRASPRTHWSPSGTSSPSTPTRRCTTWPASPAACRPARARS